MNSIGSTIWLLVSAFAVPAATCAAIVIWGRLSNRRARAKDGANGLGHGLIARFSHVRVREAGLDISALGSSTLIGLFCATGCIFLVQAQRWSAALMLAGTTLLSGTLGRVLKRWVGRTRPTSADAVYFGSSFPSNHSLMSSTFYLTAASVSSVSDALQAHTTAFAVFSIVIVFSVGFARVLLRVHYWSDVISGWLVGASLAFAASSLLRSIYAIGINTA